MWLPAEAGQDTSGSTFSAVQYVWFPIHQLELGKELLRNNLGITIPCIVIISSGANNDRLEPPKRMNPPVRVLQLQITLQ